MKYRIQQGTYRDFQIYEQNKRAPRAYFIPYSSADALRATPASRERYDSDQVTVLSGPWGFRYYADADALPREFDSSAQAFDEITVPSTWQRTGYEPPVYLNTNYAFDNPPPELPEKLSCGVYRKRFQLEQTENRTILISFLGVSPCIDLYCNGYHVGYSEGSHNTAEFDLSAIVRPGENELIAVVHKWCTGTFLECQDMFRENGIFRDVLLYTLPRSYINDFWLRPQKQPEGDYRLQVTAEVQGEPGGWTLELSIDGLDAKCSAPAKERMSFGLDKLDVTEWNAEQPTLYTAWLKLIKGGTVAQAVRVPIGFKTIELDKNLFRFNGQLIKFKGVNHHDTNPLTGYCMTYDDYVQDLTLMQACNVNTIRTSHYPPDPHLLRLADEMGFYIIDEADIECHGCERQHGDYNLIAADKQWIPRFLDRVKRMMCRDRNHVSITMWSLGNEAGGYHCQDACCAFLHAVHPEIPVHYEGASRTERVGYDVYSEMYTDHEKTKAIGDGSIDSEEIAARPFFLCEYAHAMGAGPGGLEEYWQLFYQYDNLTGGCIWEWADHSVDHGEGAPHRFTYGGDHGEVHHDGNFCVDGLVYPDRRLHTGAYEMKNVYRPLRARYEDGTLLLRNTNRFANEVCTLRWELLHNGAPLRSGEAPLDLPALSDTPLPLPLDLPPTGDCHLTLYYGDAAFEQLTLREEYTEEAIESLPGLDEILQTMALNWHRAPIDNDNWRQLVQPDYLPENLILQGKNVFADDDHQFTVELEQAPLPGGAVRVTARLTPGEDLLEDLQLPRFGVTLQLPRTWDKVRYYGLGEHENLPDFRAQSRLGIFETDVTSLHEPYIMPQDNGNHGGLRWLELTGPDGHGLRLTNAPRPLSFSAHTYSQQSLTAAKHDEDLRDEGAIFLSIDGFVRGSGSSSCGPDALPQYRLDLAQGLEFSFDIARL